jgi:tape measure domain-containing protein
MANSIAKLAILLTADTKGLSVGFARAKAETLSLARFIEQRKFSSALASPAVKSNVDALSGSLGMLTGKVAALGAGFLTLTAVGRTLTWMSRLSRESEEVRVSLEGLVGSASKAREVLADLQSRPLFSLPDQNAAARTLLATGTAVDDLAAKMNVLADISVNSGNSMEQLSDMLAKVKTDGKLADGELTMFAKAGIPLQQQLAKQLGITEDQVKTLARESRITADEVERALELMTRKGGAFENANSKMLRTVTGEWKQWADFAETKGRNIGDSLNKGLSNLLQGTREASEALTGDDPFRKLREAGEKTIQTTDNLGNSVTRFKSIVSGNRASITIIEPKQVNDLGEAAKKFEEMAKQVEALKSKGASLTQSLRTPAEIFADTVKEAAQMLQFGAITGDTYARAMGKAKEQLQESLKAQRQIRDIQRESSVSASSRFTSAGQSAMFQAAMELRRLEALEQQQLTIQKEQARLQQEANELLKKEKPQVTLHKVENF